MDPNPRHDVIRWTASDLDASPEVVETRLLLPTPLYLTLEETARQHHMTVCQMARVFLARAIQTADQPHAIASPK